jgi:hypothetical protein
MRKDILIFFFLGMCQPSIRDGLDNDWECVCDELKEEVFEKKEKVEDDQDEVEAEEMTILEI